MASYRHGFKTEAERLAAETRAELGIGLYRRLDPLRLAELLDVPVLPLAALKGVAEAASVLLGPERSAFSAMTVFHANRRVIVHNESHPPARQASNLSHELAHSLLLHPARPALDARGCRDWDGDIEREATYLAGALLLPLKAVWWAAKRGIAREDIATEYGCSLEMAQMRLNMTGAGKRYGYTRAV